jgi:hypothetical protein
MARWVASDRKDDIGLRQGGHVDTVVTLCGGGVERLLISP